MPQNCGADMKTRWNINDRHDIMYEIYKGRSEGKAHKHAGRV